MIHTWVMSLVLWKSMPWILPRLNFYWIFVSLVPILVDNLLLFFMTTKYSNKSAIFGQFDRKVVMNSVQNWTLLCNNLSVFRQNQFNINVNYILELCIFGNFRNIQPFNWNLKTATLTSKRNYSQILAKIETNPVPKIAFWYS